MSKFTVGIDIGGTNIKMGLVDHKGVIKGRHSLTTQAFRADKKKLIQAMISCLDEMCVSHKLKRSSIKGIGIGLPGLIDPINGNVIFLPNMPGWRNVPLKKMVEEITGIPTFLENDVNLIALGEWKFGAGIGVDNLIMMTLGTGVGSGLILDGRIYRGENFVAGELGHMPLNEEGPACTCGGFGCFETYVGNKTLGLMLDTIYKKKGLQPKDAYLLAKQKDKHALEFWRAIGVKLGNGLVGAVNLLNPKLIIIGGGVANNFSYFKPSMAAVIKRRAMSVQGRHVRIVRGRLKNDAGIIGARVLVNSSTT